MNGGIVQDASNTDIEVARATLVEAVLALRNMLGQLDQQRIEGLHLDELVQQGVSQAQEDARKSECILPQVTENFEDRKPLCLVKFGRMDEEDIHPPPRSFALGLQSSSGMGENDERNEVVIQR
jgi:hypothetical protein